MSDTHEPPALLPSSGTAPPEPRPRARGDAWRLVAGLLIAAFLARGPLYLCVFPPLEGWDEYQHLGYIAYLDETGRPPVLDSSNVPATLRPLLASLPQSARGADQARAWGARSYDEFWNATDPEAGDEPDIPPPLELYQAQHPPLFYVLALPLWRALGAADPLDAIYAIRVLNLLFVAAALAVFAAALKRVVPAFAPRVAVFAVACLHPLFFQNTARVANDALAIAAALTGVSVLLLADARTLLTRGLLAAGCIAASVWSKQTGLTSIPALLLGVPLIGWLHGVPPGRLARITALVGALFLVLVAPWWLWSYHQYGSIITTQESVALAARGPVGRALLDALPDLQWGELIRVHFLPGRPWLGGWSFLRIDATLAEVYGWAMRIAAAAAATGAVLTIARMIRSRSGAVSVLRRNAAITGGLVVGGAVVLVTALGMIHHALVSLALFGESTTNPWYFMTALPFLFVLLVRGLEGLGRLTATITTAALAGLFVVIDLHGTWFVMPEFFAGTTDQHLAWSRLSTIHPTLLNGDLRWLFLAIQLGALGLVMTALIHGWRRRTATPAIAPRNAGGAVP